ncbi:HipA domain-containing protein [Rhizobium sp. DKSPLA3]|uniref:HipA domain-containing protein n=1 Tax=Rhizobium quercicola TaxID=2901226 RepID=A0A9X1T940_9HYPH|nr:HipA domain-containing protein [Rhizobium quercicola]MCD7111388.1 HipA domain-containing protein [Rhizobium quercicola]
MFLTFETYWHGEWHISAVARIKDQSLGYEGHSDVEYELDYFVDTAAADFHTEKPVKDARALSINYPVSLERYYRQTWPPFMLDLMPQGHARRKLAEHLRIGVDARASDLPLLLRAGGNPIGNLRIKEAAEAEEQRLAAVRRVGVTERDILERTDLFVEVVDRFGMIASGSSGLQGEWPKASMTLASDGLYYPDAFVHDDEAVRHVIVKLLRSRDEQDRLILEGEAGYSKLAQELGLHVHEPSVYAEGVLIIPRFDRQVKDGVVQRFGQESMVSALGVAEFGHLASHEDYIDVLRRNSEEPFADILEYMKRDIANRAFGNPDNHGRNTALSKGPDGSVRLAPLFDFAPMRLAAEGIARSTRWAAMREIHRDTAPDWLTVCQAVFPDNPCEAQGLLDEISGFAEKILSLGNLNAFGIRDDVSKRAAANLIPVCEGVLEASSRRHEFMTTGNSSCPK